MKAAKINLIYTDYGVYPLPKSVGIVYDAAKLRRDGTRDRRTAASRFLDRYEAVAQRIAADAFLNNEDPKMPEADVAEQLFITLQR